MIRLPSKIVLCGLIGALLHPVHASAAEEDALAIVNGLAPGDLLNVRAVASPVGQTITRLPNGAALKNFGCGEFQGYQWCKIETIDQPHIGGWVPARYLLAVDLDGNASAAMPALEAADVETATAEAEASGGKADGAAASPPPDLSARLDGTGADAPRTSLTQAELEAYRLAYANRAQAAMSEKDAASLSEPGASAWDATGEIPCARHLGQPMTSCRVGVKRSGPGTAAVTVIWPDGGTRVIGFADGRPRSADAQGEFRFTREGRLNMIRVGESERFEITDALAFGS